MECLEALFPQLRGTTYRITSSSREKAETNPELTRQHLQRVV